MNYLIYPIKEMGITQGYSDNFTHLRHNLGNPKDYPIDDNCGSVGKTGGFYCPCNEMTVKKIYGIGKKASNCIWLESTSKVITPSFNDFVTIMIAHPDDINLKDVYVGKKYKRKEFITMEGKDGFATGYHLHISVGRGLLLNSGWLLNSRNAWVINTTGGAVKPENAFYIDPSFTKIKFSDHLKFNYLPIEKNEINNDYYVNCYSLNVRNGSGINFKIVNSLPKGTLVNKLGENDGWIEIGDDQWVSKNYLTQNKPNIYYVTKKVIVDNLNVRDNPNGKKLIVKAPLKKNTIVSIMEIQGNWTKINNNRYVYSSYVE
jgi:hypothetical protein